MYGMIHQAARQMVRQSNGEEAWREILARCGFDEEHFISGRHYDDASTLALLGAICETTGQPLDRMLGDFGRFWIRFASASAYGRILDMAGSTFEEVIGNLDRMHAGIKATMPEASMPTFELLSSDGVHVDVLYWSERSGLGPFVAGLLEGILERCGESGEIAYSETPDGIRFTIRKAARAAA